MQIAPLPTAAIQEITTLLIKLLEHPQILSILAVLAIAIVLWKYLDIHR